MPKEYVGTLQRPGTREKLASFVGTSTTRQTFSISHQPGAYGLRNDVIKTSASFDAIPTTSRSSKSIFNWYQSAQASLQGTDIDLPAYQSPEGFIDAITTDRLWPEGVVEKLTPEMVKKQCERNWGRLATLKEGEKVQKVYADSLNGSLFPDDISTPTDRTDDLESRAKLLQNWNGSLLSIPDLLYLARMGNAEHPPVSWSGLTRPYVYIGTDGSAFSYHKEDLDFLSLNYQHGGGVKVWYSIGEDQVELFEAVMSKLYPGAYNDCPNPIRHKEFLVDPLVLAERGIDVVTTIQYPGDLVLTAPLGYHSGINIGFTLNEAANFTMPSWEDYGLDAQACDCKERDGMSRNESWEVIQEYFRSRFGIPFRRTSRQSDNKRSASTNDDSYGRTKRKRGKY